MNFSFRRTAKPPALQDEAAFADDALLLARARRGEGEAFQMIFQRHAPLVRRFLGNALRDEAAADEAAQETFVRVHAGLSSVRDGERLRGWIFGIARIVLLDTLAQRRRDAVAPGFTQAEADEPAESGEGPLERLLSAEAEVVLGRELSLLGAERRAAVLLRLDEHLSYGEIAEAMGWPLQKVKNELHRARLQIRSALLDYLRGSK